MSRHLRALILFNMKYKIPQDTSGHIVDERSAGSDEESPSRIDEGREEEVEDDGLSQGDLAGTGGR